MAKYSGITISKLISIDRIVMLDKDGRELFTGIPGKKLRITVFINKDASGATLDIEPFEIANKGGDSNTGHAVKMQYFIGDECVLERPVDYYV